MLRKSASGFLVKENSSERKEAREWKTSLFFPYGGSSWIMI